jgi:hypothetical protein
MKWRATAAYQYVASRKDVDAQRVAVMAYSLGGYYAPRRCRIREALRRLRRVGCYLRLSQ